MFMEYEIIHKFYCNHKNGAYKNTEKLNSYQFSYQKILNMSDAMLK